MRNMILLIVVMISCPAYSRTLGKTYDIAEQDGIEYMQELAASWYTPEKSKEIEQQQVEAAKSYLEKPPGTKLPQANKFREFYIDLTEAVPMTLQDELGQVFASRGQLVKALSKIVSHKTLLFIDADSEEQISFMLNMYQEKHPFIKVILINGGFANLSKKYTKIPIYFDQQGRLHEYFKIKQVPATVMQEGELLHVREIAIKESL